MTQEEAVQELGSMLHDSCDPGANQNIDRVVVSYLRSNGGEALADELQQVKERHRYWLS